MDMGCFFGKAELSNGEGGTIDFSMELVYHGLIIKLKGGVFEKMADLNTGNNFF